MQSEDFTKPEDHGREGSEAGCKVLVLLHAAPSGRTLVEIVDFTRLEAAVVRQAIIGLSERRRIKCIGRGTASRWYTVKHAANVVVPT